MAPPPASMGHGLSSENQLRSRRRSSASSTRSEHFAAAATSAFAVPTISVPTPTYSSHHRSMSSSSTSQHLSLPPFRHRRSSSSASQDGYRSPSPGSSRTSAFVLPPGVSISQITPNVFVGNNASSTSIQTLMHYGITSMVSLLSTAEQQLNEDAWNSPALGMLVPKQNRLFVRCEDSPEEDLMGKLAMICKFVEDQIEEGHPEQRHRKQSVEEMLKSVLPASEVPKGFHTGTADQEQQSKPKQRVRSLIPDEEGNVEGPTLTSPQNPKDTTDFETGGKVLIHCNQGVSRSGAACVAYIMKQQPNLSARKAVRFVQVRRKEVEPSATFLRQLGVWGEECKFDVWEENVEIASDEGLDGNEVDGKGAHGKAGHQNRKKVPKAPYKKWLDEREEMRRQVKEMGGLVLPQGGIQV
ncbi:protein-tyrosine phosphatase-like protein [Neurospora hispaniola]|uniref:protein-tyrosine-phosphatase n=1 Tax=Neurospora hispaniola TaxID=588809 RepID=A0AAJ0MRC4_9PEZI|nr:protein-tyrosine phosphatase-like protein [Neurospora hispaniola]